MTKHIWVQAPSAAAKRIIFARHGEYECNVRKVCNCDPSIPYLLTETGGLQAVSLGNRLKGEGIELIVSSQFVRARQTAAIVNWELGGVPVVINRLANENRVGRALEGRPHTEYNDSIRHDPVNHANPDGGESFKDMKARISTLVQDLLCGSANTVLVVSHGWPLQAVRALRRECSDFDAAMCVGMPGNCGTAELFVRPSDCDLGFVVDELAQAA